jgi:hypothetical protein
MGVADDSGVMISLEGLCAVTWLDQRQLDFPPATIKIPGDGRA